MKNITYNKIPRFSSKTKNQTPIIVPNFRNIIGGRLVVSPPPCSQPSLIGPRRMVPAPQFGRKPLKFAHHSLGHEVGRLFDSSRTLGNKDEHPVFGDIGALEQLGSRDPLVVSQWPIEESGEDCSSHQEATAIPEVLARFFKDKGCDRKR